MSQLINHRNVSFVKSGLRILAGANLVYIVHTLNIHQLVIAGVLFIAAEVLGIVEELVDADS